MRGRQVEKQTCLIADMSGSVELTLWADHISQVSFEDIYFFSYHRTVTFFKLGLHDLWGGGPQTAASYLFLVLGLWTIF